MNTQPTQPGVPPTTETPLTISAQLGQGASVPIPPNVCDNPMEGFIWLKMFTIDDTMVNNHLLTTIDTSNLFNPTGKSLIIPPEICRLSTAVNQQHAIQVRLIACKLMGAPVSVYSTTRYRPSYSAGVFHTDPTDLYPDIDVRSLDQNVVMDKLITIPFNGIPIRSKYYANDPDSAAIPATIWTLRLRSPYVRTNIHPKSFYVHVFIKFVDLNLTGYSLDYISKNVLFTKAF